MDGNETLQKVEIRIDDGEWQNATGTLNWTYIHTKNWKMEIILYTRSYDGEDYSNEVSIIIEVKKRRRYPRI
ncbi:MAG: hypothetical protein FE041_03060 [Thermoplasmata archaeon]|nr:MAG: hypothetical protein FE041_03060 [Thermoplasmata archaeon]